MSKRTGYSAGFKAKAAKEAIKGEETLAQLASYNTTYSFLGSLLQEWGTKVRQDLTGGKGYIITYCFNR